jgi:hypothetical protein
LKLVIGRALIGSGDQRRLKMLAGRREALNERPKYYKMERYIGSKDNLRLNELHGTVMMDMEDTHT